MASGSTGPSLDGVAGGGSGSANKDEIQINSSPPPKIANNSIPVIPPPRVSAPPPAGPVHRLAHLGRPPLEKASSMPEKPGPATTSAPVSTGKTSSRNSSIEKCSSIDKCYGSSKDTLITSGPGDVGSGKDRPPLPSYEEAVERNKVFDSRLQKQTSLDKCDWEVPLRKSKDKETRDTARDGRDKDGVREYGKEQQPTPPTSLPKERARRPRDYGRYATGGEDGVLMLTDVNNIPQIDVAISPPPSPVKEPLQAQTARNKTFGMRTPKLKRFPSLRFRERFGSLRRRGSERDREAAPPTSPREINPTITITMDDDADSIISDYLHPEHNYKGERNIKFIGDDVSLYGTPKEEMSPLKEPTTPPPLSTPRASYLKDQIIAFFQPSDNKLAMKLFGNKNALMKEKLRQKAAGNWVIHPCSNFRSVSFCVIPTRVSVFLLSCDQTPGQERPTHL